MASNPRPYPRKRSHVSPNPGSDEYSLSGSVSSSNSSNISPYFSRWIGYRSDSHQGDVQLDSDTEAYPTTGKDTDESSGTSSDTESQLVDHSSCLDNDNQPPTGFSSAKRSNGERAELGKYPPLSNEDRDLTLSQTPTKRHLMNVDYAMERSKGKENTHGRQARRSTTPHEAPPIIEEELQLLHTATSMSDLATFVVGNGDIRSRPGKERAYAIMLAKIEAWHNWKVSEEVLEQVIYNNRLDDFAFRCQFTKELDRAERERRHLEAQMPNESTARQPGKIAACSSDDTNMQDDTGAEEVVETTEDKYVHPVSRPPDDEIPTSTKLRAIGMLLGW